MNVYSYDRLITNLVKSSAKIKDFLTFSRVSDYFNINFSNCSERA